MDQRKLAAIGENLRKNLFGTFLNSSFDVRFSVRFLFIALTFVAVLISARIAFESMNRLNSSSESILVCGDETRISWRSSDLSLRDSGVHSTPIPLEIYGSGLVRFKQEVLLARYKDHWGNESFCWKVLIQGFGGGDSMPLVLYPTVVGGGNTDGTASFSFDFQQDPCLVKIYIAQRIGKSDSRETEIKLWWNGERFVHGTVDDARENGSGRSDAQK